ncbi:hypothetical protein CBER1_05580 [Cercospora berteroae]|uniref:Uncharacterized protein n=1 Tax=Cercospora berteroae TaxID=357750 RepID=A0A2S6BSI1_9PEZI|nr:hypothetical protein CBER1_05580 [Cercospora berteroae]
MNGLGPFMSIGRGRITMFSPGGRGRGTQIMTIGGNGFINPAGSSIQIFGNGRGGMNIMSNGGRGRGNYSGMQSGTGFNNLGQIQQITMPNPMTGAGGGMFMSMPGMTMSIPFQGGRGTGRGTGFGLTSAGSSASGSRASGSSRSSSSRAPGSTASGSMGRGSSGRGSHASSAAGAGSVYGGSQGPFGGGGGGTAAP